MISDEAIMAFLENVIDGIDRFRDGLMYILEQYQVRTEEIRFSENYNNLKERRF